MTDHAAHHARHPGIKDYWIIGVILAVITGAEVAASYMNISRLIIIPSLIIMMIAKFAIVALYFMHLKFDRPTYLRFFVVGLTGAVILFAVVLLTFGLLIGS